MTINEKQTLKWGSGIAVLVAVISYFISMRFSSNQQHWFVPSALLLCWAVYLGKAVYFSTPGTVPPPSTTTPSKNSGSSIKWILFIGFHTLILLVMCAFAYYLLMPMFGFEWIYGFDWIRKIIMIVLSLFALGVFLSSIASCWSTTKLKPDEIGQLTISGKAWKFGKNQKNGSWGLFTGLPGPMVEVKPFPVKSENVPKRSSIQVPKKGGAPDEMFEVTFTYDFTWRNKDTHVLSFKKSTPENYVNLIETEFNNWVLDTTHQYEDLTELRVDKKSIRDAVFKKVKADALKQFGVEIENLNLERIEKPDAQVEQQNRDAAALAAQLTLERLEQMEVDGTLVQTRKLYDGFKEIAGNDKDVKTPSVEKCANSAFLLRDKIKATQTNIKGGGKGSLFIDADGSPGK